MRIDPATMDTESLDSEIEHLESYFRECAKIGQGISSKDGVRMRQLKHERSTRNG